VTEGETTRLVAWSHELERTHAALRRALDVAREAVARGTAAASAGRDLLLYCRGLCVALDGHHRGEERHLFPAIATAYPHLRPVLQALQQDHSMIASLLDGLEAGVDRGGTPDELSAHLDGVAAIMESHFRYEERQLLSVLQTLDLPVSTSEALGPL
jgi:hemerythrin-like domain-containing protein